MTPQEQIEAVAAAFNDRHPIGSPVFAFPGTREGGAIVTCTRSVAWVMGGHTAVVKVHGHAGGIALTHIDDRPRGSIQVEDQLPARVEAIGRRRP